MTKKGRSIRGRILLLVVSISFSILVLLAAVSLAGMLSLRQNTILTSNQLGSQAAGDSKQALVAQAQLQLSSIARSKAELSDEILTGLSKQVQIVSNLYTKLYANPAAYGRVPVAPPDPTKQGQMTTQVLLAEGVDNATVLDEVALLGNSAQLIEEVTAQNDLILTVQIGTESGFIVQADDTPQVKPPHLDPRTRSWYRLAKEQGKPIWSDVVNDAYGRGLGIVRAVPIYNGSGTLTAVSSAGILLTSITDNLVNTKVGKSGYVFLMNERGEVIISPFIKKDDSGAIIREEYLTSDNAQLREIATAMTQGASGIQQLTMNGKEVYMAYEPLSVVPWSVGTVIDADEVVAPAVQSQQKIISLTDSAVKEIGDNILLVIGILVVVVALAFTISMALSITLSNRIVRPIKKLNSGVREIGGGNLNFDLDIHTGDEIESLAISFHAMTQALGEYMRNLSKITADKERIATELNVATTMQASMLPCVFPAFPERPEMDIYATMLPAKEVGGDFYDFFLVDDDHLAITIADVSGKGVPAALFMVISKTLMKNNAQHGGKSPRELLELANNQLCENNESGMFVTAFLGIYEISTGRFTYANAGHNPPLLCRAGGEYDWLSAPSDFVLAGIENTKYRQSEITLSQGDQLFLYTDGVTEAQNTEKVLLGNDYLQKSANQYRTCPLTQQLAGVKHDIDAFVGGAEQADDITMLAFRVNSVGGNSSVKTLVIDAIVENLDAVLDFVNQELEQKACDATLQMQVSVAVEEIFANIANYAYRPEVGGAIIRVSVGDEICIMFEDKGVAYNPLEKQDPDITQSAEKREIGGLGIYMVKKIMDSVEYTHRDNKNILIIKKILA
ncbi:MAG: SpoIIE family protein phosphatase [Angelakisella sp.]